MNLDFAQSWDCHLYAEKRPGWCQVCLGRAVLWLAVPDRSCLGLVEPRVLQPLWGVDLSSARPCGTVEKHPEPTMVFCWP